MPPDSLRVMLADIDGVIHQKRLAVPRAKMGHVAALAEVAGEVKIERN